MISTREAFAGPWAANVRGWLWTAPPAVLLTVSYEVGTELPHPAWIVASALVQLAASGLVGGLIAGASRRLRGTVTIIASILLWVGVGSARGAAGAGVAIAAGVEAEWLPRLTFWVAVSCVWTPLLTYGFAQWDERRRLLGLRRDLTRALGALERSAAETASVNGARIAEAADDALRPALDEIRAVLSDTSADLDPEAIASLHRRLDALAGRAERLGRLPRHPDIELGRPVSLSEASADFEIRRPVYAAALTAVATAPFLLPAALRDGGWPGVAEMAIAIGAATGAFTICLLLLRGLPTESVLRPVLGRVGGLFAGSVGTGILLGVPWQPLDAPHVVVALALPVLLSTAASFLAAAVGLWASNQELEDAASHQLDQLALRRRQLEWADELAARRVHTLLRGDLNGRLASCVLALGLLAAGDIDPAQREPMLADIRAQLDAASRELSSAVSPEEAVPLGPESP